MIEMKRGAEAVLLDSLRAPRYEVIPLNGIAEQVIATTSTDVTLTVTASPAKGIDATLDLTQRLARAGFEVVPHLSARLIADEAHLKDVIGRLHEWDVRDVFVVAGDADPPAGKYGGALELLVSMNEIGHGFDAIGITGYPESHPLIDDDVTIQSMWDKRHYATYIVSNLCFNPKTIVSWVERVRRRGVDLPVFIGMPGPAQRAKLIRIAERIGVGESARFLKQHKSWLPRFFLPGAFSPGRLLHGLAPAIGTAGNAIKGFHIYTFNEVEHTERWRRETIERITGG